MTGLEIAALLKWPAIVTGAVLLAVLAWKAIGRGYQARQGQKEREADLDEANDRIKERSRPLDRRSLGRRLRDAAKRR